MRQIENRDFGVDGLLAELQGMMERNTEQKEIHRSGRKYMSQARLTGSKFATPTTAPKMATSTTPPAAMLSKKLLRDGETPEAAASATSGITMEAVKAAAVSPVKAFSFKEALT
ncbi:hypothetical protein HS088_TW04G00395 [Tripterygium wilfordii]|uniref:Uncharacterized protein n=1 Tax=Tripterygium wilfordii TaxID=458696 RepID=A0A7J7DQ36_TRIWF|nr:hypothetical protein HS088_TW04G00395 [Tripterygium wilfordii]